MILTESVAPIHNIFVSFEEIFYLSHLTLGEHDRYDIF